MKLARLTLQLAAVPLLCCLLTAQQSITTTTSPIVPRLVNYTGKVADAQEKPAGGMAGITFAIYSEQTGGAPLWVETQSVNVDARGNYTAQLGATKPEGLPLEVFTSGEARWMGVRINGGEEQPRVLLLRVEIRGRRDAWRAARIRISAGGIGTGGYSGAGSFGFDTGIRTAAGRGHRNGHRELHSAVDKRFGAGKLGSVSDGDRDFVEDRHQHDDADSDAGCHGRGDDPGAAQPADLRQLNRSGGDELASAGLCGFGI